MMKNNQFLFSLLTGFILIYHPSDLSYMGMEYLQTRQFLLTT